MEETNTTPELAYQRVDRLRREFREAFHSHTVPAIVRELNRVDERARFAKWRVEKPRDGETRYDNPAFINDAGERFWLSVDEHKRQIHAHGSYGQLPNGKTWIPRDYVRDADDPSPSFSAEKTPERIAADIVRRLLPQYRIYLEAYQEAVKKMTDYRAQTAATFAELITIGGGVLRPNTYQNERNSGEELSASLYGSAGVNYSGDIRVSGTSIYCDRMSLAPELFRRVVKVIADYQKDHPIQENED